MTRSRCTNDGWKSGGTHHVKNEKSVAIIEWVYKYSAPFLTCHNFRDEKILRQEANRKGSRDFWLYFVTFIHLIEFFLHDISLASKFCHVRKLTKLRMIRFHVSIFLMNVRHCNELFSLKSSRLNSNLSFLHCSTRQALSYISLSLVSIIEYYQQCNKCRHFPTSQSQAF